LIEWEVVKEDEVKGEKEEDMVDDQEDELEVADKGEMLVLRRALNNQNGVKDEHRGNIFHSKCAVQGKVFSLIIN